MKTYLVTGGAGFIGSNFIHYMFEKYDDSIKIINVDKLTYAGNLENLKGIEKRKNYTFQMMDICDNKEMENLFSQYDIDYVINFAAESHVDRSILDPLIFVQTNMIGTQVLLNICKEAWKYSDGYLKDKKFVQISTDEVYGALGEDGFFTETTPINPHSPYSVSKASADLLVKAYYDTYQLPINITRCSNNYGPYQHPEKLIPLMINNALQGKDLPVYGKGTNIRDWLYVKDHCQAIDMVVTGGKVGEVYNIGGHNEKQNIEVVKTIIDIISQILDSDDLRKTKISEELIKYIEDRKGHDWRYAIDPTKITRELGWQPTHKFEDGIKKTIKWYLKNQLWLDKVISGEYQQYYNNLYMKIKE